MKWSNISNRLTKLYNHVEKVKKNFSIFPKLTLSIVELSV